MFTRCGTVDLHGRELTGPTRCETKYGVEVDYACCHETLHHSYPYLSNGHLVLFEYQVVESLLATEAGRVSWSAVRYMLGLRPVEIRIGD